MGQALFREPWERAARRRRFLLLILILLTTILASSHMADILPRRGSTPLELAIVIVFALLFGWVSIGFWEAMAGLYVLLRRYDRFAMSRSEQGKERREGISARTAILYPICNEEIDRVLAGLRATHRSIEKTGQLRHFDFFILSDSSDPDKWVEEEIAWADLCRSLNGFNRVFYRHRRVNLKRKSGNIADFCRRWGRNYRYMVVMDADSVMSGSSLVRVVHLMEENPKVGMLQTVPLPVNRQTLLARVQQFANHAYGPVFAAGLHFMQLGDSHFWGHNAIIRVAPFIKHCGLPQLPGKPPRGGYILSHDFVEAAFMRRGGWEVWLAYDLGGSYEELPPTLLEELKRDRRWCQGNIQHIRLLFTKGLFSAHRALFLHGALSYISALLWVLFLSLSTAEAIVEAFRNPVYFPSGRALFPDWPIWHPQWALTLLGTTALVLFSPKLMGILLILARKGKAQLFGGHFNLVLSMLAEVLLAALFAPIRMLFHTKFVISTLLGRQVGWGPQQRSDRGTGWLEALRFHGPGTLFAFMWAVLLFLVNRSFFWWSSPIFIPLLLSIPLSVWSSRVGVGRAFQRLGLFLIPEELHPPPELSALQKYLEGQGQELHGADDRKPKQSGFVLAVVDPVVNSLHRALLQKGRAVSAAIAGRRRRLQEKALGYGPDSLSPRQKKELLSDPTCLYQLHLRAWETEDQTLAEAWGIAP